MSLVLHVELRFIGYVEQKWYDLGSSCQSCVLVQQRFVHHHHLPGAAATKNKVYFPTDLPRSLSSEPDAVPMVPVLVQEADLVFSGPSYYYNHKSADCTAAQDIPFEFQVRGLRTRETLT